MSDNRLFQMVYVLLDKRKMTASELADRFEVSVRTIYRDIDMLSASGIPVYMMPGKGGGVRLDERFVLSQALLTEQERRHMMMALQGFDVSAADGGSGLLSKLGALFQRQEEGWIEIEFTGWLAGRSVQELFERLKDAIWQRKQVTFTYFSGNGDSTARTVEPLKLAHKSRDWFLYGYCSLREDFRFFKLTRMKRLNITERTFVRPVPARVLQRTEQLTEETVSVTLQFDAAVAFRVYDEFPEEGIVADGQRLVVRAELPEHSRLYSYLLSFGDQVEVLEPPAVRERMAATIANMQSKYIT